MNSNRSIRARLFLTLKPLLPRKVSNLLRLTYQRLDSYLKYGEWNCFQSISLEVSVYCNRTCTYCPNTHYETPREFMSEEVFNKALERLKEINYSHWGVTWPTSTSRTLPRCIGASNPRRGTSASL